MMFGSTILEVAIGIIFVYLLMSLLCSALGEFFELLVKYRARDLEKGIAQLLGSPELTQNFFNHAMIRPLFQSRKPSYIPARTFSLALWNMATAAAEGTPGVVAGVTKDIRLLRGTITTLPPQVLPDNLKGALVTLIDEAEGNFDKARENVEHWYNDAMDRVSGGYKRRTQLILIGLGLALSIGLNVDSINIVNTLSHNSELRATVVAAAENYAKTPLPTPTPGQSAADAGQQFRESVDRINRMRGEISGLGLPVGWSWESITVDPRGIPASAGGWALKLTGWLLTAFAVSQGAPFWFDMLNKIIVIRSTVKPHEKSREQPSKDRRTKPQPDAEENEDDGK
jgi:hypothetical protein